MNSLRLILSNPRYFAPAFVFSSLNLWFGTWAIYIPTVKAALEIDKASLGIALFFLSLGVFSVFPFASRLVNRIGVGRATWYGVCMGSLAAILPIIAPNYLALIVSLYLFGISNGFLDISMNTLVTEIEKEDGKAFMSAAHGFFSLGGILAGLGGFLIPVLQFPPLHMGIVIVIVFLINYRLRRNYFTIKAAPKTETGFSLKVFRPLLLLGIVSFLVMGGEGAVVDWSGLYLKEVSLAPEILWGSGFLAFSTTMTLGRFFGDGISSRLGSVRIVAIGAILAIIGYLAVLSPWTLISILGFGLVGVGFSVIVPELFRIGGKIEAIASSQGVAFIAGTGYAGFLASPPILGILGEKYGMQMVFVTLLMGAVVILAAILKVGQKK
jgi:fucose permease